LIKTDSAGYELWSQTYGSTSDDSAQDIQEVFDGGFVLTGYNDFLGGGQYDLWLIRVDGDLMRIISPNGGEEWRLGTEHDIRWQSTSVEDVIIELMDGDVVGRILTEGTPNDGIFEWAIPTDVVPNDNYYIRCTLADSLEQDLSNHPFAITALPTLTLTPFLPPIIIDDFGGGFWYWMEINNNSPYPGTGQYWTEVILPNGYTFGPLSVNNISLGAFDTFAPAEPSSQWVPGYAPAGVYEFVMNVGVLPNVVVGTDSFEFEKLAGSNTASIQFPEWSVSEWQNEEWDLMIPAVSQTEQIPVRYALSPAYPNPFNPSTTVTVSLPEEALLNISVYNVMGRHVDRLAGGHFAAGEHHLIFNAHGLAAGIYFIHTSIPDKLDQVQKVMFVK